MGAEERGRLEDNCIVGKIRKPLSFLLVRQETEMSLDKGRAHEMFY